MKYVIIFAFFGLSIFGTKALGQSVDLVVGFENLEKKYFKNNDTCYIINFWATWCKPCVAELPYFENYYRANKNKKIKVILVSLDFQRTLQTKLIPFVGLHNITSTVVLLNDKDYNRWLSKVDNDWGGSIPATLLIKGNKRQFIEQEFETEDDLAKFIYIFNNNKN